MDLVAAESLKLVGVERLPERLLSDQQAVDQFLIAEQTMFEIQKNIGNRSSRIFAPECRRDRCRELVRRPQLIAGLSAAVKAGASMELPKHPARSIVCGGTVIRNLQKRSCCQNDTAAGLPQLPDGPRESEHI
jgi:hypothetical protein